MTDPKAIKPDCYKCTHRREVPGSAHSECAHPATSQAHCDPVSKVMSIFASVGRTGPVIALEPAKKLGITANPHGIANGWFNWPYNFDPVWLKTCTGFEAREV